jgi:hypothetical protein
MRKNILALPNGRGRFKDFLACPAAMVIDLYLENDHDRRIG